MNRPHISTLTGLGMCLVAMILLICKIEDNRKIRDALSTVFLGGYISTVESSQLLNRDLPKSERRQRAARELGVLSRLGYVLTADEVGDHKAQGEVHITAPDGRIFKSDSMSISSDGKNILLRGRVFVTSGSGFVQERWWGSDAFARIAMDGSSQEFIGMQLFEPGSTMMIVSKVQSELDHLPTNKKPNKSEMATPRKPSD